MTLLIESNILDIVFRVELVFESSVVVTKAFSFSDKENWLYTDLPMCQFILKAVVSAGILLFWLVKWFYSLLLDKGKKSPSIFHQHIHQSSFLETVFDILYVLLC